MKTSILKTLAAGLIAVGLAHAANYSAWSGHRDIILNTSATGANIASTLVKFPVLIRLTQNEAAIMAAAKPGGADIRFSKADGTTPLPYQIDTWEPWGAAIWVLVDSVKGNNATQSIKMYWGNGAAVSESNGNAVFDTANGYVGVWHLGNAAGASPRPNSVAGAPTATFRNAPITQQPVRGIIGMADSLTGGLGSDDGAGNEAGKQLFIDLSGNSTTPYAGYSDFSTGMTYSVWVNANDNYKDYERFLQMIDDTTWAVANSSTTRIMFLRHIANDSTLTIRASGQTSNPNTAAAKFTQHKGIWRQVAFTKGGASTPYTIYVDGAPFFTFGNSAAIPVSSRQYAWIGRSHDPANSYLNAKVDAPMMSKVQRSADWMKLAFENQKQANTLADIGLGGPITTTPYAAWSGHRTITLNTSATGANVKGNVANFPVLIRLTAAEAPILNAAKAGGADIRFSKIDDATSLPYAIESWDSTGAAIWVKVDTVKGNNSTQAIRMHWGNPAAVDSSRSAAVFDTANGYRAVFHMQQPSGDVTDATANAIVGTNTGTTMIAKGLAGRARNFGGTNAANTSSTTDRQYIEVGTPGALSFAGRASMSAWVRWTNVVGTENETYYRTIINRDGTSPSAETFLRIGQNSGSADYAQYTTGKYTGSADIIAQSPQLASAYPDSAVWVHLAGVYDSTGPTNRVWNLYRNGVLIATSTDNANAALTGAATRWRFGRGPANQNARWFAGDMDEVQISSVTRDSNWVKLSYENQKPGNSLVDIGTYVAAVVPFAPTGVTATASPSTGSVNVSWTAPGYDGGSALTGYTVTSNPGAKTCTATPPATTCAVTGLTSGSYTFTVVATNAAGNSPASAPSSAVTSLLPGSFVIRVDGKGNPYTYRIPAEMAGATERVTLTIVNLQGKRVWSRTVKPTAGIATELTWDGRNTQGDQVSAGMYIARVHAIVNGKPLDAAHKGLLQP